MIRNTVLAVVAGAGLVAGGLAMAQSPSLPAPSPQKPHMSMDGMMKECRKHCQEATEKINKRLAEVDEARRSNDPAKMRSELDDVHASLTKMRDHMTMCMSMMDMMGRMHDGGMHQETPR